MYGGQVLSTTEYLGHTFLMKTLQPKFVPDIIMFPNEEDTDILTKTLWFQQDGSSAHLSINVTEYHDEIFAGR